MRKQIIVAIGLVLLLSACLIPRREQAVQMIPAAGIISGMDFINDSNVYLASTSEMGSSGWATTKFIPKTFTGNMDMAYGFPNLDARPGPAQLRSPHNVTINHSYTCPTDYFEYTTDYFWCYRNVTDYINGSGIENGSHLEVIYEHSFEWGNLPTRTAYWTTQEERQWKDISGIWTPINYNYDGKNLWYFAKNLPVVAGVEYEMRFWLDVEFTGFESNAGKYDIAMKPSAKTIQQAIADGQFYLLDPFWSGGSWGGAKNIPITQSNSSEFHCISPGNDSEINESGYEPALRIIQNNVTELSHHNQTNDVTGAYELCFQLNESVGTHWVTLYFDNVGATYTDYTGFSPRTYPVDYRRHLVGGMAIFDAMDSYEDGAITGDYGWAGGYAYAIDDVAESGVSMDGTYSHQGGVSSSLAMKFKAGTSDTIYMAYFIRTTTESPTDDWFSNHGNNPGAQRGAIIAGGWPTTDEWGYYSGGYSSTGVSVGNSVFDKHTLTFHNSASQYDVCINDMGCAYGKTLLDCTFTNVTGFVTTNPSVFNIDLVIVSQNPFNVSHTRPVYGTWGALDTGAPAGVVPDSILLEWNESTYYTNQNPLANITVNTSETSATCQYEVYNLTTLKFNGNTSVSNMTETLLFTLGSGNTTRWELWNVTVKCNNTIGFSDYASIEINISSFPPNITSVTLPTLPDKDLNLNVTFLVDDIDSTVETCYGIVNWSKNGVPVHTYDELTTCTCGASCKSALGVPASATTFGDDWSVNVTPYDGTEYGTQGNDTVEVIIWANTDETLTAGTYNCTGDASGCIIINASNIQLNCSDVVIVGGGALLETRGIFQYGFNNVTINDCTITLHKHGIYLLGNDSKINNVTSDSNSYGITIPTDSLNNTVTYFKSQSSTYQGIYISGGINNTFINATISSSAQRDVYLESIGNKFIDSSFSSIIDVYVVGTQGGTNYFLNTSYEVITFKNVGVTNSITRMWYLDVHVNDTDKNDLQHATVNISDKDGNLITNSPFSSDASGNIVRQNVTAYWQNSTYTHNYNNYTFYTNLSGYITDIQSINLTTNKQITVTLSIEKELLDAVEVLLMKYLNKRQ